MERQVIIAKLSALQNSLAEFLRVRTNFLSTEVSDLFTRYERIRDVLHAEYSSVFDDLPIRAEPKPEGISGGIPILSWVDLNVLHKDVTYCLDALKSTEATLPAIDVTREGVFFAGQYFDALQRTTDILSQAQQDIAIIDGYVSDDVLKILTSKASGIKVQILTKANSDTPSFHNAAVAFNKQYGGLSVRTSAAFHDRFVIIDDSDFFHFGASIKDLGHRGFMFSRIEELEVVKALRAKLQQEWAKATVVI